MQHKGPDPHSSHGDHDHDHGAPGHDPDHGRHHDHDPATGSGHASEEDGHVHSPAHSPPLTADGINARMGIAVGLNVIFVAIEGTFGFLSNSVALIADAGHNLGDVLGLVCAWTAIHLARRPPGGRCTYGLGRTSVLAALTNAVLLLVACGAIAWEAIGRLAAPPTVAGVPLMWAAGTWSLPHGG